MADVESKAERKLVNFRADAETLEKLEALGLEWGCNQTQAIVNAINDSFEQSGLRQLDIQATVGKILELLQGLPDLKSIEEALLRAVDRWKTDNSRGVKTNEPSALDVIEAQNPRGLVPANELQSPEGRLRCRHCGTENALPADAKPLRPCPSCFRGDHRPYEPCPACIKEQHQKEMAEKHGTEHVDYNTDWGA